MTEVDMDFEVISDIHIQRLDSIDGRLVVLETRIKEDKKLLAAEIKCIKKSLTGIQDDLSVCKKEVLVMNKNLEDLISNIKESRERDINEALRKYAKGGPPTPFFPQRSSSKIPIAVLLSQDTTLKSEP